MTGIVKSVTIVKSVKIVEMEVNVLEKCSGRYFETKIESLVFEGNITFDGNKLEIIKNKYNERGPFSDFIRYVEVKYNLSISNYSQVCCQLMDYLTPKTFK